MEQVIRDAFVQRLMDALSKVDCVQGYMIGYATMEGEVFTSSAGLDVVLNCISHSFNEDFKNAKSSKVRRNHRAL